MSGSALPPETATPAERRLDAVAAARLGAIPASLPVSVWDIDAVPVPWLPVLAYALSVELWDDKWSVSAKRKAIRDAIALHREKGTVAAVYRVLAAAGAIYSYTEPAPFRCRIAIQNSASLTLATLAALREQLNCVKRASVVCDVVAEAGLPLGKIQLAGGFTARMRPRKAFVLRLEES